MVIRMRSNCSTFECEFQVADDTVYLSDNAGLRTIVFDNFHDACAWVVDQVKHQKDNGFSFIN